MAASSDSLARLRRIAGHFQQLPDSRGASASSEVKGYNVDRLRACFSALRGSKTAPAYFDGPGGTQVPDAVGTAVAKFMTSGASNRGASYPASQLAEAIVRDARAAVSDLLDAYSPDGVVFGRSFTALCYDMARNLSETWQEGDEIIVTNLDHDSNIRPWVQAAGLRSGVKVRQVSFDAKTGVLDSDGFRRLLRKGKTRLVAVTGASNIIGTRPDLRTIVDAAHASGALVFVDGVHLTPHTLVSVRDLNADFYGCSAYKWFGPHLGILVAKPKVLATVQNLRLRPMQGYPVPDRFEFGTLPYELLAGVVAAIDFISNIKATVLGLEGPEVEAFMASPRRSKIEASMKLVQDHELSMLRTLSSQLKQVPGLTILAGKVPSQTPTLFFKIQGFANTKVATMLASEDVYVGSGHFYAMDAVEHMGLGLHGAVRAGLAAYTSRKDVDRLVQGVRKIVRVMASDDN